MTIAVRKHASGKWQRIVNRQAEGAPAGKASSQNMTDFVEGD
jgi:hypothetical protein